MSALAAIVARGGERGRPDHLQRMLAASPRPGDRTSSAIADGVALGFVAFDTLPDSDLEQQPLVDERRGLAVVFDGRLDNRDDLAEALDIDPRGTVSDVRLVLEAFARWGTGMPARLAGDFALAVWDAGARRLIAARDHMGVRPLYFSELPRVLLCATDLRQILAHPDAPCEPDESAIADYLSNDVPNGAATLYKGVRRVPAGHMLRGGDCAVSLAAYWRPEPGVPLRYRRDEEYAEHCRELIAASVRARLRTARPAAALLSGGIDSSSVVSTGVRILRHPQGPQPYSLVYPNHPESDETPYIRAVCTHCGIDPVLIPNEPLDGPAFAAQSARWLDAPGFPADEGARPLHRAIASSGRRVALTGAGADFLFSGSIFQYADLLRRFRVIAAIRRFIEDGRGASMDQLPLGLLQAGIWPLLPVRVKRVLAPTARRFAVGRRAPSWLRLQTRRDTRVPDRPRGGSHATEEIVRMLESGMLALFLHAAERTAIEHGVELRHPFMDVRLIEFALAIPEEQRRRGPYTKFVVRQALGNDLPDEVRLRRTKGDFGHLVVEALERLGGEQFFSSLRLAEDGWVAADRALERYREMRRAIPQGHEVYGAYVPELWALASIEVWRRAAFPAGCAIAVGGMTVAV